MVGRSINKRRKLRYRTARNRVKKLLESGMIDQISVATGKNAKLVIHRMLGKPIIFRGRLSKSLQKYIIRKQFSSK